MKALTYVELDVPYCSLTYAVLPCSAGNFEYPPGTGTLIGNMTDGGGIAAAFDNDELKTVSEAAARNNGSIDGWVGIDFGAPRVIKSISMVAPSNGSFVRNSANTNVVSTAHLEWSDDGSSWTSVVSGGVTAVSGATRVLSHTGLVAHRYWRVRLLPVDGSSDLYIAEIDFFGFSPTNKCFNTWETCQAQGDYTEVPTTLRFASPNDYLPKDIDAIPCLVGEPDFTPGSVLLGDGLGERSMLRVRLRDHKHSDAGEPFDKYWTERSYYPNNYEQGTLFGKFRARQPYLQGAEIRWIMGFEGDALADMESRVFVVDSFEGPDHDGIYTIIAKDLLKVLDSNRALCPPVTPGYLLAALTSSGTSATLRPVGVGNLYYAASGRICIGGKEICTFTRAGDALTLSGRGGSGTTAQAHEAEDRVQQCIIYTAEKPSDILYSLLVTFALVPAGYCLLTKWEDEVDTYLGQFYGAVLAEPTPVKQLVNELLQVAGLAMWWDDVEGQIRLKVIREVPSSAYRFTPENRLAGSLEIIDQPDKRITRVQTYFGLRNPTEGADAVNNYRSVELTIDADAEEAYGYKLIRRLKTRWIPQLGDTIAAASNAIFLARFVKAPRKFTFDVLRSDVVAIPQLGEGFLLQHRSLQDVFGNEADMDARIQVTKVHPGPAKLRVEAEEMLFGAPISIDPTDHTVTFSGSRNNVDAGREHDLLYPVAVSGDVVTFIIEAGVIIGSTSTANPAFELTNYFVAGVVVNLVVNGRIQGKGGAGGRGAYYDNVMPGLETIAAEPGQPGGTALYCRETINLSGSGEIWGGGGGGGGGGAANTAFANGSSGGGGGGGQGTQGGAGAAKRQDAGMGRAGTANAHGDKGDGVRNGGNGGNGGTEGSAGAAGSAGVPPQVAAGAGGAAGKAIDGNSFITETGTLDIDGARTG